MIAATLKPCDVYQRQSGSGSYGEPLSFSNTSTSVNMSISLLNQEVISSSPAYIDSTHLGLTVNKSISEGQMVTQDGINYIVNLVNNTTRMAQVFLKKI